MVPVDGGVAYTVEEATMSNGLVVGTKELVDAQALVLRIAKSADPQLAVETRTDQVKWK